MGFFSTIVSLVTPSHSVKKTVASYFKHADKPDRPPIISVHKIRNLNFERFAQKFVSTEPEILFTCEYIIDDELVGCLVVWEKFADATHYEVFKKNHFKEKSEFERVLFLDTISLSEERTHFDEYVNETLGINLEPDQYFCMLDTSVKRDRVYEYKIVASRVPKNATEVDYDMIMEGKNKVNKVLESSETNNIFDFSNNVLGARGLAWTIALLNERLYFFGKGNPEKPLAVLLNSSENKEILVPTNVSDIMQIINDSIMLFGVRPTFEKLATQCNGLSSDFTNFFLDSIDESKTSFSYDKFRTLVKKHAPVFNTIIEISKSSATDGDAALSKLSISVPDDKGSESLSSVGGITKVFRFVNTIYRSILFAQDKSTLAKLEKIDASQDLLEAVKSGDVGDILKETGNALELLFKKK